MRPRSRVRLPVHDRACTLAAYPHLRRPEPLQRGRDRRPQRLDREPPRPRPAGVRRPARPLRRYPGDRARRDRGPRRRRAGAAAAAGGRGRRLDPRQGPPARGRQGQQGPADRRDRGAGAGGHRAQRVGDAAVRGARRRRGQRGAADALPLPRPTPAAAAGGADQALAVHHRGPDLPAGERLHRHRDADPDQQHARGGARLPGAEPRAPGQVLRAAAEPAGAQADLHDLGRRPLLPDRALLPRRGPAR